MRTWRVVVAGIFGMALLAEAPPARADDGVRLTATAGWAGRCHPGRPLLVRASITADRLVSGVLSVEVMGGSATTTEVPVEVSGGTEEEVVLVASASSGCEEVQVTLQEAKATSSTRVGTPEAGDTVLLGLLPGARRGQAAPASATARSGVAAVAPVEPELLDRAGAIDGLDSIGITTADLDALTADQRRSLTSWVAGGGTLLVDGDDAGALSGLPEAWRPGPGGRVAAGRGQVRLTGTALRDGRLDGLGEPGADGTNEEFGFAFEGDTSVRSFLQEQSGLRVLSLPVILGALALYVAIVGPGTRIGLRRIGRLQLTWLVVPLTAVAFTGLAVAGGDILRRGGRPTHASVVEVEAAGNRSRSFVGVPTRSKGTVAANLPPGWLAISQGAGSESGSSTIRATASGQRLQTAGQAGGFVVLAAEGPSPVDGRLGVRLDADGRRGTVRNDLKVALEDVALFAPGGVVLLGHLEPGGTADFATPSGAEGMNIVGLAHQVWQGSGKDLADPNVFPMLAGVRNPFQGGLGIVAAGWTDRLDAPMALQGGRPSGTTLVLGRAEGGPPIGEPVRTSGGRLTNRFIVPAGTSYRLALNPDPFGGPFGGPFAGGPRGFGAGLPAEVLVGNRWVPISDGGPLPDGASADGVVYVRTMQQIPAQPTLVPS